MGPRLFQIVRVSTPLVGALVAIIAVQVWWTRGYSATGHAAEHLASATVMFGVAFVLCAIVWGLPDPVRRRPGLWVLLALVAVAAAFNARGNMQVVDAIGDEHWTLEDVDSLGPTRDGFEAGHDRAEQAALAGVVAASALAVWLGFRRVITPRLCVGAVVACVLFPFWIFPGLGMAIIAGVLVVRRVRRDLAVPTPDLHPAAS